MGLQRTERLLLMVDLGKDSRRRQPSTWFLKEDMIWGKGFPSQGTSTSPIMKVEIEDNAKCSGSAAAQICNRILWERRDESDLDGAKSGMP